MEPYTDIQRNTKTITNKTYWKW